MATLGLRGNQACGCQSGRRCGPRKFDAVSGGRWQRDACHPKAVNIPVGGPTSTFNKLLAARDGGGDLVDVGKEIPTQSAETHSFVEGTKVILKCLTVLQYNGQARC